MSVQTEHRKEIDNLQVCVAQRLGSKEEVHQRTCATHESVRLRWPQEFNNYKSGHKNAVEEELKRIKMRYEEFFDKVKNRQQIEQCPG